MVATGTVKGRVIELDETLPVSDGTRVNVSVLPAEPPRRNSPRAWLQLAGTLTEEEGEMIRRFVEQDIRRVDWDMWGGAGDDVSPRH